MAACLVLLSRVEVCGMLKIACPRISVVVPHLNEPDDLRRCLRSLDHQTADGISFEVIVVDNGSRVSPEEVCSEFDGVRLEREPIPGPGPARSRGASVARGEIISFIDCDCIADVGWISGIAEFFDHNCNVDIIAGDIRIARSTARPATAIEAYESVFGYLVQVYVERDCYAATGNMSVRRDVFRRVGPFAGISIAEDREWGQRATAQGFRLAYVPHIRVFTAPCKDFNELTSRWDRAIAHDFQEMQRSVAGHLKWILLSVAVAGSPIRELARILRSDRLSSFKEHWLAFKCLLRIRLYRARRMLKLLMMDNSTGVVGTWNRT